MLKFVSMVELDDGRLIALTECGDVWEFSPDGVVKWELLSHGPFTRRAAAENFGVLPFGAVRKRLAGDP